MYSSDSLLPKELTPREMAILEVIRVGDGVSNQQIATAIKSEFGELHRNTILGNVNSLLERGLARKIGAGGVDVKYIENIPHEGYKSFDVEKYFLVPIDERIVKYPTFNQSVFALMRDTFTNGELEKMKEWNEEYRRALIAFPPEKLKKEFERFTIELAWKSAHIEGNTYSLIDTEILLKFAQEAKGHDKREATEILNHKRAIEFVLEHQENFKTLSVKKVVELHSLLISDLGVDPGVRNWPVGIIGTRYQPMASRIELDLAVRELIELINAIEEPIEKAFAAVMLVAYIQPFIDGNKRTSRILSNAILLAHGLAPMSYRSVDEAAYKKGIVLFYEQNSFRYFKELFIEQFRLSIQNYFSSPA